MSNKNVFESLGDYMRDVFDKDGDGVVSLKEAFGVFPNMAIPIAIMFVDVLVMVSEYRVWQFGYYVTGDEILAIGFVLVSAVPFLLGQLFWLYPRATFFQKVISIGFICLSLYTSANFGLADLTKEYNIENVFTFLVQLTAAYTVATLIYIVIDPTIKANRMKKKAEDAARFEREKQVIARAVLTNLRDTLNLKRDLESEFGSDEVSQALSQLNGKKKTDQPRQPSQQPMRSFASDTKEVNPQMGQEPK